MSFPWELVEQVFYPQEGFPPTATNTPYNPQALCPWALAHYLDAKLLFCSSSVVLKLSNAATLNTVPHYKYGNSRLKITIYLTLITLEE